MSSNSENDYEGCGGGCSILTTMITMIFVILKLTGCIAWPWWTCFIPVMIWPGIPLAVAIFGIAVCAAVLLVLGALVIVLGIPTMLGICIYKMIRE